MKESLKFLMLIIHSTSGGVYGAAVAALFEPPAGMAPLWYAFRLMGINAGFCGKMHSPTIIYHASDKLKYQLHNEYNKSLLNVILEADAIAKQNS